jgi:L-amino acid N-acyltransferase YncA
MPDFALRPAERTDVAAITRIYAHAVLTGTATFEIESPDDAEMARRHAALVDAGYPYVVAEAREGVVGYAYAGPYRTRPAYYWSVEDSIYVAPAAHRRGIGRALLARLIEDAAARGFRQMIAVVGDSRQVASIELHRALGFSLIGTLVSVGFKHGRWLDTVLMQRALGPGDRTGVPDLVSSPPR